MSWLCLKVWEVRRRRLGPEAVGTLGVVRLGVIFFSSVFFFFSPADTKSWKEGWVGLLADLVFLNTWKIRQQQCGRRAPCCLVSSLSQELNHYVAGDSVQPLGVWAYRVTRGRNHSEFQVSASCRSKRAFVQLFILWQHTPIGVCLASQWQCVHQIMPVCDTQTGELDWTIKKLLEDWYLRLISIGGDAEESEMEDAVCERVVQWSWSESLSKCCMHECLWQKHSPTFPSCTAADVTWAKRRAVKWQTEAVWIIL